MVAEKARRRSQVEVGAWITMADSQEWLFGQPPAPGVDPEYDDLAQALLESHDRHEARRFELAIAILLLSKNYQPSPREYEEIFSFRNDDPAHSSAQQTISTLIWSDLDRRRAQAAPPGRASASRSSRVRTLPGIISTWATHFRSTMAPRAH
jgi:hypothetical protein